MSQYIVEVTNVLNQELRFYEHILLLLRKKQECLVKSDPDGIRRVTFEIEDAISKIKNLESKRSQLLDKFVATRLTRPAKDVVSWQKAFPDDDISEQDLTAAFREHDNVKAHLRNVLTQVARIQDTNRLLIEQGQEVLQSCMECLMTQVSSETYDSTGAPIKLVETDQHILDQRA